MLAILLVPKGNLNSYTLQSGINVGPTFIDFGFFSRPYSIIKGPTFIKFWNFYKGLQNFSSLMGFLLHKFAHFVHALRLFKVLRLFFLTNFPGPTIISCPTSIPDSRVISKRAYRSLFVLGFYEFLEKSACSIVNGFSCWY